MTALPKHWPSSLRQGKRRATHTTKVSKTINCKHCGQPKMVGFECPNCHQI